MAKVRVTTTVEATDELGLHLATVAHTTAATVHGAHRFLATYARGACQANEQAVNNMLVAQFGDVPRRTES